jgi:HAD superfamily hydrolase (TIGR01450 family)
MKALPLLNIFLLTLLHTSASFSTGTFCRTMRNYSQRLSTTSSTGEIQVLNGVRDLVDKYDLFLLDMWGVMHDGATAYEGVLEVVSKLKEEGKDLIILSNSSKRQNNSIKMLKKLGFDPSDFSEIITSGEVAYHMLSKTSNNDSPLAPQLWNLLESAVKSSEKKVFCFGSGDGDEEYLSSCGWKLSTMEKADLIVARGTFTINDGSTVIHKTHDGEEAYFTAFHEGIANAAQRRIPMIVANPDKIRPDVDCSPMPGTIGSAYENTIGENGDDLVKYIGKPFSDVYEIALRNQDRSRACMVGDALETDISGATSEAIDSIWVVRDGIHNNDVEKKGDGSLQIGCAKVLEEFNQRKDTYAKGRELSPTVVLPHFRW